MSATLDAPTSERAREGARPSHAWLMALLRRLHFYAGILVGPFLVIAALSGLLYVFTPQLERAVYADALTGTRSEAPWSIDRQVRTAQREIGTDDAPVAVRPAAEGGTTRVMFADPSLGRSESRGIFVDPGTGRIVGDMTVYGTSGALPLRTTIDRLHRDLLLGEPGRLYSELAASWLGVMAVSGVVLVVLHRRRVGRGRRARVTLVPRPGEANAYRRTRSWHTATGVWLALGFLFLAASGLTWSAYAGENVSQLRSALHWATPKVSTALPGSAQQQGAGDEHAEHHGHQGHQGHTDPSASFDAVLTAGLDSQLVEIRPAASRDAAWTVAENDRSWPTQVDSVAVDPRVCGSPTTCASPNGACPRSSRSGRSPRTWVCCSACPTRSRSQSWPWASWSWWWAVTSCGGAAAPRAPRARVSAPCPPAVRCAAHRRGRGRCSSRWVWARGCSCRCWASRSWRSWRWISSSPPSYDAARPGKPRNDPLHGRGTPSGRRPPNGSHRLSGRRPVQEGRP
nr:PepSY-associated TM helix domain-containing protein [Kocuria marina]